MRYLKPNISDNTAAAIIADKIEKRTPFAFTRYGDGEIYFLNDNTPEALQKKFCNLWGYKWPTDYHQGRKNIVEIITRSLIESDMLGFLDPRNAICEKLKYDEKKWSLPESFINNLRTDEYKICDHQLPRGKLFGDINNFKKILNGASLNIISPNTQLLSIPFESLLDSHVKISTVTNDRHTLLDTLDKIEEDVVIYGASLSGKDIGVILKEHGKISLDFGATLDAWAGIQSRSWFAPGGPQNHCLINIG